MNNTLAIEKINSLVDNEESHLAEYKNVLLASSILPKEICKIAIIGPRSKGKCILINLLAKENIASNPSISLPIFISRRLGGETSSPNTIFCNNNNVKVLAKNNAFYWTRTHSFDLPAKQSLDKYLEAAKGASGIFVEYTNSNHEIAQKACLLLPPDISSSESDETRKKHVLNAADIADIILLVATPTEINSNLYDFIYTHPGILDNKLVIAFIIHDRISNFYHYPLNKECKEADNLEKTNWDSAKGAYDTIQKPYTSGEMTQMLNAGMTKDTQNLLQNIEMLIKKNFDKTQLHCAFFLPTGETPLGQKDVIVEDQKLISDINNWQLAKIYTEIAQAVSKIHEGNHPGIAWEYLFRKSEDICFDTIAPICQRLEIEMVADYARLNILNQLLAMQKEELSLLLRDYVAQPDEEKLKKLFNEYRAKNLGFLPQSKESLNKTRIAIRDYLKSLPYEQICGRIKQQYDLSLPSIEMIVEGALSVAPKQEDVTKFIRYIKETIAKEQIIVFWQKESPLELERNSIINEHTQKTTQQRQKILSALDAWINISELVDCKNEIAFIVKKRDDVSRFSPETLFPKK